MKNILRLEIKKALVSKSFVLGIGLLTLFSFLSGLYSIENYSDYNPSEIIETCIDNGKYIANPDLPLFGFYNAWVGGDTLSLAYVLFFNLMPIAAALPYAWSFYTERKNGYLRNIAIRVEKKYYIFSKTIAVFISGALTVLIAYLINLFIVSAFVPMIKPDVEYNLYNIVYFGTMWSDLFFLYPFIHLILFVLLGTMYGGIFAISSFALSFYVKKLPAIVLGPFITMMLAGYIEIAIADKFMHYLNIVEFIPIRFLHSRSINFQVMSFSVALSTIIILLISLGIIFIKGNKDEIF